MSGMKHSAVPPRGGLLHLLLSEWFVILGISVAHANCSNLRWILRRIRMNALRREYRLAIGSIDSLTRMLESVFRQLVYELQKSASRST